MRRPTLRSSWPTLAVLAVGAVALGVGAGGVLALSTDGSGSAPSAAATTTAPLTVSPVGVSGPSTTTHHRARPKPPASTSTTHTPLPASTDDSSWALPYRTLVRTPGTPAGTALQLSELERLPLTQVSQITYRAHTGDLRTALVLWPRAPSPRPLPLVIAVHGRGGDPVHTCAVWGDLPGYAHVAVVCPEGQGRVLGADSWGDLGQIDDLARMPGVVGASLPQLRLAPGRVYAIGASMGGQETLLLVARHPQLLAGAVAIDPVVNLISRYHQFEAIKGGPATQVLMREEVGATPDERPDLYAVRSPIDYVPAIANARTRLEVWWSRSDYIVHNQQTRQSGIFLQSLARQRPRAPVLQRVGTWSHSWPYVHQAWAILGALGLLDLHGFPTPVGVLAPVARGTDPALRLPSP
jgi:pimeloyl-ACP methyl ester carboxylesterase